MGTRYFLEIRLNASKKTTAVANEEAKMAETRPKCRVVPGALPLAPRQEPRGGEAQKPTRAPRSLMGLE